MKTPLIKSTLLDTLSSLWTQLHAALLIPIDDKESEAPHGDSDFEGWLRRDPFVIRNRGNRYYERPPSDVARNGL